MRTRTALAATALLLAAVPAAVVCVAPPAAAEPQTVVAYPRASTATVLTGRAFDTCTAPSLAAMSAWKASPYRGIGVYIGGRERSCTQPQLTASWVSSVAVDGWRLIPIFLDRQASCTLRSDALLIANTVAATQGTTAAREAIAAAAALGMRKGSAIYYDMENYRTDDAACRAGVLRFLSSWTKELHRQGYLAGVYVNQGSGARDLAGAFSSTSYARPDAVWIARFDGVDNLTGWPTVPDSQWTRHQRAKQYVGDVSETYGGVTMRIDRDRFDTPVATVALPYKVASTTPLNGRGGPSTAFPVVRTYAPGSPLRPLCQTSSQPVGPTAVWDRLADGNWVTDHYVSTPSSTGFSPPLPRCSNPFQTTATGGLTTRAGPGAGYAAVSKVAYGSLAWVRCQTTGSLVGTTRVWDLLDTGRWVSDYYVADASSTTWTTTVPRCWRG